MIEDRFDFEFFFPFYFIRRGFQELGSVFRGALMGGEKRYVEYRVNFPCGWESKFVSYWSHNLGNF